MRYFILTFLLLLAFGASAKAQIIYHTDTGTIPFYKDSTTHAACQDHFVNGSYQSGWAACTAFEVAYNTRLLARAAARVSARAAWIAVRNTRAQQRLGLDP